MTGVVATHLYSVHITPMIILRYLKEVSNTMRLKINFSITANFTDKIPTIVDDHPQEHLLYPRSILYIETLQ
jgi:head-tail adaptor